MSRTGGRGNLTGDAPEAEPRSVDEWKEEEADDDDDDDEEEEAEDGCMCMACTSVPAYVASTLSAEFAWRLLSIIAEYKPKAIQTCQPASIGCD